MRTRCVHLGVALVTLIAPAGAANAHHDALRPTRVIHLLGGAAR